MCCVLIKIDLNIIRISYYNNECTKKIVAKDTQNP